MPYSNLCFGDERILILGQSRGEIYNTSYGRFGENSNGI